MALAKPAEMDQDDFLKRAREVSEWFTPLNPYELKGPLLKIEDENYAIENGGLTGKISPLYCLAISAKRYALFNLSEAGKPIIRKASRNGLGYLLPPEHSDGLPPDKLKSVILQLSQLEEWEYDLWAQLVESGLEGSVDRSPLNQMSVLNQPGVSRYAATTPGLLRWFSSHNAGKAYADQVKPFNFLLCLQPTFDSLRVVDNKIYRPAPIAPYDSDFDRALSQCFDRRTGFSVPCAELKTYLEILNQFHLHPEAKFLNGDFSDVGPTLRRHVIATSIEHIGKESNRLEEQWYTGVAEDAQIHYGSAPTDLDDLITEFIEAAQRFGTKNLAKAAGLSVGHVRRILTRKSSPSDKMILKLRSAIRILEQNDCLI